MIAEWPFHRLQGQHLALKKLNCRIWRNPFATVITAAAAGDRSSDSRPGDLKKT